jgi:dynein heavy chain 1
MNIGWEHFVSQYDAARFVSSDGRDTRHIQFVREFASVVSVLQVCDLSRFLGPRALLTAEQDKTNNVIDLYKDILRAVEDLATCSYTEEALTELLSRIQSAVRQAINSSLSPAETSSSRLIDSTSKAMQILIIGLQN